MAYFYCIKPPKAVMPIVKEGFKLESSLNLEFGPAVYLDSKPLRVPKGKVRLRVGLQVEAKLLSVKRGRNMPLQIFRALYGEGGDAFYEEHRDQFWNPKTGEVEWGSVFVMLRQGGKSGFILQGRKVARSVVVFEPDKLFVNEIEDPQGLVLKDEDKPAPTAKPRKKRKTSPCALMKQKSASRETIIRTRRNIHEHGYRLCRMPDDKEAPTEVKKGQLHSLYMPECRHSINQGSLHTHPSTNNAVFSVADYKGILYDGSKWMCMYSMKAGRGRCVTMDDAKLTPELEIMMDNALRLENKSWATEEEVKEYRQYLADMPYAHGDVCSWQYSERMKQEKEPPGDYDLMGIKRRRRKKTKSARRKK